MELVDDEDMETMGTLYCGKWSHQNAPIQLFVELANVEPVKDLTPLGEEHEVHDPCMVVLISYIGSQSTIYEIDIDLNVAPTSENQNSGPRLQIHSVVFETEVDGNDGHDNSDPFNHKVANYSHSDLDEVLDDIKEEGTNDDENVNSSSFGNLIQCIVIRNDPGAHILLIDHNATHVVEFSEYLNILPAHRLVVYFELEESFVGQKFKTKEECVFAIKWFNMNVLVDYKVAMSKSKLYI
ncbi:hypothetical protein GOBAR_DD08791 [Gossypium barbadense]|nr:hypothetical protein GOBAR_DD08791 [Gossypium barbadense]